MDDRGKMEAVQLGQLVLPVNGPRALPRRLALPEAGHRPKLTVIVTPPEVRERWQRWVAFRQSMVLTVSITFGIIAATYAM